MDTPTPTCEFEGIVEDGQIRLAPDVHLPEKTKVIVLVRDPSKKIRIRSPRLVHPEDAEHFKMEVTVLEDKDNAVAERLNPEAARPNRRAAGRPPEAAGRFLQWAGRFF